MGAWGGGGGGGCKLQACNALNFSSISNIIFFGQKQPIFSQAGGILGQCTGADKFSGSDLLFLFVLFTQDCTYCFTTSQYVVHNRQDYAGRFSWP